VKNDWKNFKKQKTNQDRRKHLEQSGANHVRSVRDHFDPFDGAIGSYKLLSASRVITTSPARHSSTSRVLFRIFSSKANPKGFESL
jgi:hypothetical protein